MIRKNKAIGSGYEVPLLEQEKIDNIEFRKASLSKRRMLLLTVVLTLFVISIILLFFKAGRYLDDFFYDETTDKVSSSVSDDTEKVEQSSSAVESDAENTDTQEVIKTQLTFDELYSFDQSKVKEGEMAVIPMDISMTKNGSLYINNSTGLMPDVEKLLSKNFNPNQLDMLSQRDGPKVLILHTHASESYLEKGQISHNYDESTELARTANTDKNVVSLGSIIADVLNSNGISTVHCCDIHDSIQQRDSYLRSEACIKEYLEKYPTIQLVIDIGRDDLITSSDDIIRPVTLVENEPAAQVSLVVGSNWGGAECVNWVDNLSLALKLREQLNKEYINFCRPVELRAETYNQELSTYSIHIDIGSIGNNLEEARISARCVAITLLELLKIIPF